MKNELFNSHQLSILQRKIELLQENNEDYHPPITVLSSTLHRETIEAETKVKVKNILSVIEDGHKICISYVSQTANLSNRIIQPLKLNFMNGSWYLEAYCEDKEALRLFKLTRIRNMELIKDKARSVYSHSNCYLANSDSNMEQIILLFSKSELGKLYDFFTDDEISILEDRRLKVTFNYDVNKNILPFIMMFGRHVKILSPQWLKDEYMNEIEFIYKR